MLTQKYESLNTHESLQNMRFRLMKTTLELDHYLPTYIPMLPQDNSSKSLKVINIKHVIQYPYALIYIISLVHTSKIISSSVAISGHC